MDSYSSHIVLELLAAWDCCYLVASVPALFMLMLLVQAPCLCWNSGGCYSWITSMEDVSRGEERLLTSVLLTIWNGNVRWLGVQDFATGFLNLVLHLYPFSAIQLSHFICNYWHAAVPTD